MTVPEIIRRSLLTGVREIPGAAVVIDTFRAFSTAAYLFERDVARIVLTETLDEARLRSELIPGSILCGEDGGRRPDDFVLGNSPTEVMAATGLAGRIVVMRTSSGTRGVVAALRSTPSPVFAASLVVADATAAAVRSEPNVTIIASGLGGTVLADEDEETADLIAARVIGRPGDPGIVARIRAGEGAHRLTTTPWIDGNDLDLCLDVDRFVFALRARITEGVTVLERSTPGS
jgi:2-phosphosulfolactate phosphatase